MGNITQLKQGSLNGLRRQTNECIDNAYRKGYEDGKKEPREVANVEDTNEYQIGYKEGRKDGFAYCRDNSELIPELKKEEYNKALEDVDHALDVLKNMTGEECAEWFEDCVGVDEVVCGFTVQRIVEIIKAYEEKKKAEKESIKVGDVIYSKMTDSKAIIISFDAWDNWNCIDTCGTGFSIDESKKEFWKKIGHFDEVEQLLDKLRGEE